MKTGKIIDNKIVYTKFPIIFNGKKIVYSNDTALLSSLGEKQIVLSAYPNDGKTYIKSYIEDETSIKEIFIEKNFTEEEKRAEYEKLCGEYISAKYSLLEENKIVREFLAGKEESKKAFDEYNFYVENCKAKAKEKIYG